MTVTRKTLKIRRSSTFISELFRSSNGEFIIDCARSAEQPKATIPTIAWIATSASRGTTTIACGQANASGKEILPTFTFFCFGLLCICVMAFSSQFLSPKREKV